MSRRKRPSLKREADSKNGDPGEHAHRLKRNSVSAAREMNLTHRYKAAKAGGLATHSHTSKKPENPARILRAKHVESAEGRENLGSLGSKEMGCLPGPRKQSSEDIKFRRSEKRPLVVVRVPSILRNNVGRAICSEPALQKVKRKTMLNNRASHREKTGTLKKKEKKSRKNKEFLKIFKSLYLQGMSIIWKNLGSQWKTHMI